MKVTPLAAITLTSALTFRSPKYNEISLFSLAKTMFGANNRIPQITQPKHKIMIVFLKNKISYHPSPAYRKSFTIDFGFSSENNRLVLATME